MSDTEQIVNESSNIKQNQTEVEEEEPSQDLLSRAVDDQHYEEQDDSGYKDPFADQMKTSTINTVYSNVSNLPQRIVTDNNTQRNERLLKLTQPFRKWTIYKMKRTQEGKIVYEKVPIKYHKISAGDWEDRQLSIADIDDLERKSNVQIAKIQMLAMDAAERARKRRENPDEVAALKISPEDIKEMEQSIRRELAQKRNDFYKDGAKIYFNISEKEYRDFVNEDLIDLIDACDTMNSMKLENFRPVSSNGSHGATQGIA